jgi:tetratricopeptide (TPR) repeat protein
MQRAARKYLVIMQLTSLCVLPQLFAQSIEDANLLIKRGHDRWVKGEYNEAIKDYTEAIKLAPGNAYTFHSRGVAFRDSGALDKAIADFTEAVKLDPQYAQGHHSRGITWLDKGEIEKGIADFDEAIRLDPEAAELWYSRALARMAQGEDDKAIADFNATLRLNPKHVWALGNRGVAWNNKGDYDKAIADYTDAIRLSSKYAPNYNNRGWSWWLKGEWDKAIADYRKAIELAPDFGLAHNNLARLLATCPDPDYRDGKEAYRHARRACELAEWKSCGWIDTLAAAYAECSDYPQAVKCQTTAVDLAPEGLKSAFRARLELYKAKKPYREESPAG